ncbi:uncharacterized protein TrAtP1_011552 [Trichoderma atroviride]|uniref:F-box domain-containing protein n=1 Tax=Hypocrea atroviridis (strain ATCC 20476 / IMI 206040) TaxID=452589 RepID=G9P985_HYPAI|nr:uncharacterized protein TRIATDRAFT_287311 [Trichoderma atroviride IMI 206040]EHK41902.1 hypothetical protein TRIATDRAFT_287311 [Trichoderma atroviride IMI 206040]UKZ70576.1 hypothetical protein TrAtP1_011552 [Trichoderma atroviride]
MDSDVSALMIGTFGGNARDDFGKDAGTRRCLLLDIVMQGRKRESRCRLFQMPAEILADIVDFLADDKSALACLALVNSDCRYLARSCQFAEIHFDYSHQSRQLLLHLAEEALRETDLTTRTFPIGRCVRSVIFASRPECVMACYEELHNSIFSERASSYSEEQRAKLQEAAKAHYITLRNIATLVVTCAMPNLEVFTWKDPFSVDDNFLKHVSRCSAQHIRLQRVKLDKPWRMEPPLAPALWPLRSLDFDVELAYGWDAGQLESEVVQEHTSTEELENPISGFFETLFQRCAATLESLSWQHMGFWSKSTISLGHSPLSFPLLRYLRLGSVSLSPRAFSLLLSSPLKHLELPTSLGRLAESLVACEPLRDLQSLIIPTLPPQSQACMHIAGFIKQHKHVHKLFVHEHNTTHMDRLVVPILAEGGFNNLRCLSLAWGGEGVSDLTTPHVFHIPEAAIMTLGTIVSLERLSLRAGNNFGWRNQWLIDHDKLRQHLRTLSRLKMLALVRDTYPISLSSHIDVENYYSLRLAGESERVDARAREDLDIDETSSVVDTHDMIENQQDEEEESEAEAEIWERAHRNRMLAQAEAYAAVFPALDWVLCGQRPMGFHVDLANHVSHKKAIPLTQHRDECYTFLKRTFGISE